MGCDYTFYPRKAAVSLAGELCCWEEAEGTAALLAYDEAFEPLGCGLRGLCVGSCSRGLEACCRRPDKHRLAACTCVCTRRLLTAFTRFVGLYMVEGGGEKSVKGG